MAVRIDIDRERIIDFCKRNHIRRLALFGSVLRPDFRPDSDVDVLVEFDRDERVGLIRMARMEMELSTILARAADLRTAAELSRYFRDEVLASAEVLHEG